MTLNKKLIIKLLILIILVGGLSYAYKRVVIGIEKDGDALPEFTKDRKIVELWIKDNYFSNTIEEQIENYNIMNKDHIFVNCVVYGADYVNMLRMKLLTSDKPDIFDIGTFDIMRNDRLYPINKMGVDLASIPANKKRMYKNNVAAINVSGNVVKFVWNKEIFRKCGLDPNKGPETWQQVREYAKIIKEKMPQINPFEAQFSGYSEFKRSIGEPSVNSDTITTNFWNYKKGVYDYSSAKYMLDFYRDLYKSGLMPKELKDYTKDQVREDFYNGKAAMFISFYDDKVKFLSTYPLSFDIGISNLPKIKITDQQNYFFVDDLKCIGVNSLSGDRPEVRKVFEWYAKVTDNADLVTPYKYKSKYFKQYGSYDDTTNFKYEDMDPTPALNFGQQKIKDMIYSCISGETGTQQTIDALNKYLNDYCNEVKKKDSSFFNSFIGKE